MSKKQISWVSPSNGLEYQKTAARNSRQCMHAVCPNTSTGEISEETLQPSSDELARKRHLDSGVLERSLWLPFQMKIIVPINFHVSVSHIDIGMVIIVSSICKTPFLRQ